MEKEKHSLKASSLVLNGSTFDINDMIYKNNYLYLSTKKKSDFAMLRNVDNSNCERMNLALFFNKSDAKFNIQFDSNIVLNAQKDRVGINTTNPTSNLDVIGSGIFSEDLLIKGDLNVNGKITGFNVDIDDIKESAPEDIRESIYENKDGDYAIYISDDEQYLIEYDISKDKYYYIVDGVKYQLSEY
jgi:hypothetical protein